MDPEVVEIKLPALISQSSDSKKLKQKEVNHHEIIDIDIDEDSSDLMIIDEKVDRNKGKAIKNVSDGYFNYQAKDAVTNNHASPTTAVNLESLDGFPSSKSFAPGVHSSINIDGFVSDLSYDDDDNTDIYSDDFMDDDEYAILQAHFDNVDIPPGVEAPIPWLPVSARIGIVFILSTALQGKGRNKDDILNKFRLFKQFDTVQDHSDHHYSCNGSSHTQPSKNWAKKIQEEWKILEKDLPDTISVRVYETRIDLLRAVIVGAEGTPYHDGLFFFDVFFPVDYPNAPPLVHYRSGGLRLNPNLYDNGKVCLSLLNTWSGDQNEKWIPGLSTMLQVLVSIQGLILNAKPFFNEPGFACMSGSASGEKRSLQYNENTFILSLKTMLYSMKKPPRHFEDFVLGHFCKHAHDILVACKAYMDGAQVGCLVKGGVQDVDEGDKSCSKRFKDNLAVFNNLLVKTFTNIGATGCEKFLTKEPEKPPPPERLNRRAGKSLKGVIIAS
ncbi:unnamed protein product, partial [Vitis vinifera]